MVINRVFSSKHGDCPKLRKGLPEGIGQVRQVPPLLFMTCSTLKNSFPNNEFINFQLVGGFEPLWKIILVNWDDDIPTILKNISHVPNHQPVENILWESWTMAWHIMKWYCRWMSFDLKSVVENHMTSWNDMILSLGWLSIWWCGKKTCGSHCPTGTWTNFHIYVSFPGVAIETLVSNVYING